MTVPRTITYVETASTGHCPGWVQAVTEAFVRLRPECRLNVWLPNEFRTLHHKWAEPYFSSYQDMTIPVRFECYDSLFEPSSNTRTNSFREIILRCIQADTSRVCFIANHVDTELKNIAFGGYNSVSAKLVGVMDYPFLHYCTFNGIKNESLLHKARFLKWYALNLMASRRKVLGRVLMVDPLAPAFYRRIVCSRKYQFLPEAYSTVTPSVSPRRNLSLPDNRTILLFIGGTERRKGICELLYALEAALREEPALCSTIAFVLAGRIISETRESVLALLTRLRVAFPDVPFIVQDELLSEQQFVNYIEASDIVCLPYVKFVGTSNLLVHAARAGRPVLTTNTGIVGELALRYELGLVCDTSLPESLQKGLLKAIEKVQGKQLGNQTRMTDFIHDCAVPTDIFGEAVIRHLTEVAGTRER